MQGAWVRSLLREQRSHKLHAALKKKKKKTVLRVTCNLPGSGGSLLTLLTDKAGVGLLLRTVMFADGGGVLEGKTTSGFTGQTYTI